MSGPSSSSTSRAQKSTNVRTSIALGAVRLGLRLGGLIPPVQTRYAVKLFTSPRRHPRPDREDVVLSEARPFALEVDGRRLAAWRWGDGPAVLLVHGWEGRGAQLGTMVRPLVDRGFGVVTFDASAHGDSPGDRLYLTDMARTIVAATEAILDGRAGTERRLHAIIAHSFGAAATTLVLGRGMLPSLNDPRDATRGGVNGGGFDPARGDGKVPSIVPERVVYLAPALVTGATERFARLVGLEGDARRRVERRIGELVGLTIEQVDGEQLAPRIAAPLLIIHDDADEEVPLDEGRRLAAAWPDAVMRVTSGLGHNGVLWRTEAADPAVAFVAKHAPLTREATRRAFLDGWVDGLQL